ncbi:MAG: CobD/CbiB family cobalamin biosynthesis protein, partial [Pseudomonadota bacterium]
MSGFEFGDFAILAVIALVVEALFGYPSRLFSRIGHPVTWIGAFIGRADSRWNLADASAQDRRRRGVALAVVLLVGAVLVGGGVQALLVSIGGIVGLLIVGVVASSLVAQRSLHDHVCDVADRLEREGLDSGRQAVSHIVGRDPSTLDEAAVCRAAIESLSENFSDGIVAPVFWLVVG